MITSKFLRVPPVCLVISKAWGNCWDCCCFCCRGQSPGPLPWVHRCHRAAWIFRHQYVHTQRVELCVPGLLGGDSKPSGPNTAPQQPSTHKLLLIKPAGLIMGCSIKYVSRCFRCSLRVLVKAGEASDQGCWPCKHSAHPPLAWMPGCACLQVPHNLALLICSVACRKHRT